VAEGGQYGPLAWLTLPDQSTSRPWWLNQRACGHQGGQQRRTLPSLPPPPELCLKSCMTCHVTTEDNKRKRQGCGEKKRGRENENMISHYNSPKTRQRRERLH